MIDLHTHILCGVDDGAKTAEESIEMLRIQREQGVDTVVLTPHFHRVRQTSEAFLHARAEAFGHLHEQLDSLDAVQREGLPKLVLGAEVAWHPNMAGWDDLENLCIEGTKNMLLELPFVPWSKGLSRQLYDLINRTGITPILVHLERYLSLQKKQQMDEILELGLPVQISSSVFLHQKSRAMGIKLLKSGVAHLVASDCHDPIRRKPNLKDAMEVIGKKLGEDTVHRLNGFAETLLEA